MEQLSGPLKWLYLLSIAVIMFVLYFLVCAAATRDVRVGGVASAVLTLVSLFVVIEDSHDDADDD
jgi:hypothetical protein